MKPVVLILAFLGCAQTVSAQSAPVHVPDAMSGADIVYLGEIHDNPAHHLTQAAYVAALSPSALVFEMLTPDTARSLTPTDRASLAALEAATGWTASGWPELQLYFPVFAASDAPIFGAGLPRPDARAAMKQGISASFGEGAEQYGLTADLPTEQQSQREAMQMSAHCDALPEHLLPTMVDLQRLRDAMLARAALTALDDTGGPVVVITGNGHARRDWGAPNYVARLRPALAQFSLGQTEGASSEEPHFDLVLTAEPIQRPDPCAAFR